MKTNEASGAASGGPGADADTDTYDAATVEQALAIQADAGTASAVEYLKAHDVEGSVIEQVLSSDIPAPAALAENERSHE